MNVAVDMVEPPLDAAESDLVPREADLADWRNLLTGAIVAAAPGRARLR